MGDPLMTSRLLVRELDRGVTLAPSSSSFDGVVAVDEGCSDGASRRGVRYPPGLGVASLGVRGGLFVRWKAALSEGVNGLEAIWPAFCFSEVMIAGVGYLMALRDSTISRKHDGHPPTNSPRFVCSSRFHASCTTKPNQLGMGNDVCEEDSGLEGNEGERKKFEAAKSFPAKSGLVAKAALSPPLPIIERLETTALSRQRDGSHAERVMALGRQIMTGVEECSGTWNLR